jgi:hypothetical protein
MFSLTFQRHKPQSACRHLSPERERAQRQFTAPCYMHHAICTLLSGIAYFRRKKHGNQCTPSLPHSPRQDQSESGGIELEEKSLDAAAIKISVGFYKNCAAIFYTDKNNMIR